MYNGVLIIRKEKGYTSNDVVQVLRGILKQKKIGHTGTLDPDAEGVLPVCLGHATKLAEMLTAQEKEYEAGIRLGIMTDTQDMTGNVLQESSMQIGFEQLKAAADSFLGDYMQTPPMYSAVKIGGKKLYEIARKGKEIDRPARKVTIHSLELADFDFPQARLYVSCSKGTYIRTLCHDIGCKLGCGACMSSLVRIRSGRFTLDQAITLDEVKALKEAGKIEDKILSLEELLSDLPAIRVSSPTVHRMLRNGNRIAAGDRQADPSVCKDGQLVRAYDGDGILTGVYQCRESDLTFHAYKMFI